jgi:hypothetical protein
MGLTKGENMAPAIARREASYKEAAKEAFGMELIANGGNVESAVSACIEVAVATAHRDFVISIRDDILEKAEDLDASDNDMNDDGPAALIWYAILLDEILPPELRREIV